MADRYRKHILAFKETINGSIFYIFDVETSGLSATENDIIEFSALRIVEKDGTYTEDGHIDIYINPGYEISEEITALTGITNAMLAEKGIAQKEAVRLIQDFWGENPVIMGYNSVFDQSFVNSLYSKIAKKEFTPKFHLDVLKMAREKAPGPHKLIDMANLAGAAEDVCFHRSIDDVKATFAVFKYFLPMYDKEEPKQDASGFEITDVKRWKKSETLDRIYVNNTMNISVYYDVVAGQWHIGGNLDDIPVLKAVYTYCNISDDNELVSKIA